MLISCKLQAASCKLKKGFTLIELVMTMVILAILAAVVAPLGAELLQSFQYTVYRKNLSESADVVLRRIGREIRRLKNDKSVITAGGAIYRFIDIDNNIVQFRINGTALEREYNGQTDILATNILALSFAYLDDTGAVIATPIVGNQATDIRFIEINTTFQSDNNTIYCRTQVRLRNIVHISDLFS